MTEASKVIEEKNGDISIEWSDGIESTYSPRQLRLACPCAGCVNEWTGEKMLKDDSVPSDITFTHISIVGRYALNFHFSDGHETGIFSFKYLREMLDSSAD